MMRDKPPSRYPAGFDNWPAEKRLDWMQYNHTREGLMRVAFALAGYEMKYEIDNKTRMTKEELAALVIALDPDPETLRFSNA